MTNLTEISMAARKFVILAILFIVGLFILRLLIGFAISYWKATHPPALPLPDVKFGKLSKPQFPSHLPSSSGLKFTLENIAGKVLETTASGKVYSMPKKLPSLAALEKTKSLASRFGFLQEPQITGINYSFEETSIPLYTLIIDSVHMNYTLLFKYPDYPFSFTQLNVSSQEQINNQVKNFLKNNSLFDESILKGKTTVELLYYNLDTKTFEAATSLSTANSARVNFFRNDVDNLKLITSNYPQGYNYVIYANFTNSRLANILEIHYKFWPFAQGDVATYPLKKANDAYQELVDGYAAVVSKGENDNDNITIRNIYLAYYDSEEPQLYLQPIFVFEGDKHFLAFLEAISNDWYQ